MRDLTGFISGSLDISNQVRVVNRRRLGRYRLARIWCRVSIRFLPFHRPTRDTSRYGGMDNCRRPSPLSDKDRRAVYPRTLRIVCTLRFTYSTIRTIANETSNKTSLRKETRRRWENKRGWLFIGYLVERDSCLIFDMLATESAV